MKDLLIMMTYCMVGFLLSAVLHFIIYGETTMFTILFMFFISLIVEIAIAVIITIVLSLIIYLISCVFKKQ
jgi:hypothetical protein